MTGLKLASLFCVLLIQRAAGQSGQIQCASDITISLEDLLRAIGQGNCNQAPITVQEPCSCNQASIPISIQQPCGCQPSLSIAPSLSVASQPIAINQRSCGCQPSNQCGPSYAITNQQSLPSSCGCGSQPSFAITNQPSSCGCGSQPSFAITNQPSSCGCGIQQPSFAISQPVSIANQLCGCQPVGPISIQQCGSGNQKLQAAMCLLSSQGSPCEEVIIQAPCYDGNVGKSIAVYDNGGNVANIVPASLLQAPPFGIFFAGENLLIDGPVQVCGSMPFTSAVQISGRVPASGSGCVKYECS